MAGSLEGRIAVVTGAGSGMGRAVALRFAAAGARVLASDRDDAALGVTLERIAEAEGEATGFACDVTGALAAPNLLASALDAYGRIDVLVNAARQVAEGDALESDGAKLTEIFESNVRSAFQLSQAAARRMIAQRREAGGEGPGGAIVNVTSIAARRTVPALLHYSVACAALDQLTRSMALALAPHGVRVNAVALGSVMTASLRQALRERAELRAELTRVTPMGRIADASEAAEAALFLASGSASFVTGQIVTVDGGRMILDPLATPDL